MDIRYLVYGEFAVCMQLSVLEMIMCDKSLGKMMKKIKKIIELI